MLDTYREPNEAVRKTRCASDLGWDRGVGHRGGNLDQGLHATEALGEGEHACTAGNGIGGLHSTGQLEADHPTPRAHLPCGKLGLGVARKPGIVHALHCFMPLEHLRQGPCILAVALHPQVQGLGSAEDHEGIHRTRSSAHRVLVEGELLLERRIASDAGPTAHVGVARYAGTFTDGGFAMRRTVSHYASDCEANAELSLTGDASSLALSAAPAGEGPDIFITPHDRIGEFIASGIICPVDVSAKADQFVPSSLDAFTAGGELYGMPFATENVGFFRNVDLVPEPAATWDDVQAIAADLKDQGEVQAAMALGSNNFHVYGLHTAFGGYIFGKDDAGNWDPTDVGIDSEGFVASGEFMQGLVEAGLLRSTVEALGCFSEV